MLRLVEAGYRCRRRSSKEQKKGAAQTPVGVQAAPFVLVVVGLTDCEEQTTLCGGEVGLGSHFYPVLSDDPTV